MLYHFKHVLDRRLSAGNSPSGLFRLSENKLIEDGSLVGYSEDTCDISTAVTVKLPKQNNAPQGHVSPEVPSPLATNSKNIEKKRTLRAPRRISTIIAPRRITEELDVDDCETEINTNEGKFNLF